MLQNRSKKIPYVQVKQKKSTKLNLIKNTPSKLHKIHQRRSILRNPPNIQDGNFCKNS